MDLLELNVIRMKVKTADLLAGIIRDHVNFYRFNSKDLKIVLTKNFVELRKVAKQAATDQAELVKKFQEDWKDEIAAVQTLRDKQLPVEGHNEYLKAEAEGVETIQALFDSDVQISLIPVNMEEFVSELDGDDITPEQVAILAENGFFAQE